MILIDAIGTVTVISPIEQMARISVQYRQTARHAWRRASVAMRFVPASNGHAEDSASVDHVKKLMKQEGWHCAKITAA